MSKKYGSVFSVYLGPKKVIVLAGYETVKQALVNYAVEFGNRDVSPLFFDISKGHGKSQPCASLNKIYFIRSYSKIFLNKYFSLVH